MAAGMMVCDLDLVYSFGHLGQTAICINLFCYRMTQRLSQQKTFMNLFHSKRVTAKDGHADGNDMHPLLQLMPL